MKSKYILLTYAILFVFIMVSCRTGSSEDNGVIVEENTKLVDSSGKTVESLGIETLGGVFSPLIEKGTETPFEKTYTFSTAADNQDQLKLSFYRGTKPLAKDNSFLGKYQIIGIPLMKRGEPQIAVTIKVFNKQIQIFAKDNEIGKFYEIIKNSE